MSEKSRQHLIAGNSTAAVGAVEAIRAVDKSASITIVAAETEHTYSRPLITYYMAGKVPEDKVYYRPMDWYDRYDVERVLGVGVDAVCTQSNTVRLSSGEEICYENLLLAAGGSPIKPNLSGIERPGVFFMNTMDDARMAKGWLAHCSRAVVIGAGLTGLKTAEALVELGQEVTVVELADRVLLGSLDDTAAGMVRQIFVDRGVDVLTGVQVTSIEGSEDSNDVTAAVLSTGEWIACDTVFVTVGVRPRIELAAGTDVKTDRGILVDRHMRTNVPNVYAAGDIAQAWDPLTGGQRVVPILPNAYIGGRVAGLNMAGREADYNIGMSVNSVSFFGEPFMSAGFASQEEGDGFSVIRRLEGPDYRKFVIREGRLVGMIVTENVERAGIVTGMMRAEVDVTGLEDDLLEGSVTLMSLPRPAREQRIHGDGRNWL